MIRSLLLSCLVGASIACTAHAAAPDAIPENLVIAGDWPAIVRQVTDMKTVDPITNFIAGHAFLATDHANEAMCSFAVGAPPEARAAWSTWTSQLAAAHPTSAVAHYLEGDAFARNGDWAAARAEFDRALTLAPNDPLVRNARAVVEAAAGNWPAAQADLLTAAGMRDAPMDVQTNQAVLAILHRDDASAAGHLLEAVLKRFPNHVIGLVGQGAVAAADHQWESARGYYRKAISVTACVPLALDNLLLVQEAELKEARQNAATKLAQATPGTQVYKNFETATNDNFAFVHANTLTTAAAVGALAQNGNLGNFQNPADRMGQYAVATGLKSFGAGLASAGNAIGGWMLVDAATHPTPWQKSVPEATGAIGTFTATHAIQNVLDDFATKLAPTANWTLSLPPPPPINNVGGLRSAPPPQAWDNGNWPVTIWPVLLYAVAPATVR